MGVKCPTCGSSGGGDEAGCSLMIVALAVLVIALGSCAYGRPIIFCNDTNGGAK